MSKRLIILIHGLAGAASDFKSIINILSKSIKEKNINCKIFVPDVGFYRSRLGIEEGVKIILNELKTFIDSQETKFHEYSIVGHSLGGIYGRYLLPFLKEKIPCFQHMRPIHFISLATPHLGSRRKDVAISTHPIQIAAYRLGGQTGRELILEDEEMIVYKLATEQRFLECLEEFESRTIYCNMRNDLIVSYCTSAITLTLPTADSDSDCMRKGNGGVISAIHDASYCMCFPSPRKVYTYSGWDFELPISCGIDETSEGHLCRKLGDRTHQHPYTESIRTADEGAQECSGGGGGAAAPAAVDSLPDTKDGGALPNSDLPDLMRDRTGAKIWEMYLGLARLSWTRVDVRIGYEDSLLWAYVEPCCYKAHEDIIAKDCSPTNHGRDVVLHMAALLTRPSSSSSSSRHRYGYSADDLLPRQPQELDEMRVPSSVFDCLSVD